MAQVTSYLHLHDPDDDILTVDSLPYWADHSDFDLYASDTDFSPPPSQFDLRFHDDVSDADSVVANHPDDLLEHRENQVNFVMDLFQQRVEQSQVILAGDNENNSGLTLDSGFIHGSGFGVIGEDNEIDIDGLGVGLGLELGFGSLDTREDNTHENSNNDNRGRENRCINNGNSSNNDISGFIIDNICNDNEDDFFVERRVPSEVGSSGLRVIGIGSDSDSDDEHENGTPLEINLGRNSGDEYVNEDDRDDEMSFPLCWDSLQLEDHRETNEDFEWEEIDGRVDEREVLSMFIDDNDDENSISLSISPIIAPEDVVSVERVGALGTLEWEVLLNANNLETSAEMDGNHEHYFGDHEDLFQNAEYEMLFGQFGEHETAWLGHPPTSKSFVENLPEVVLTQDDVDKDNGLCAVCKDEINVGEKVKQLPCSHRYHGDCIVPWLGIRNTCPVCRHELPTDDAGYERRRIQRVSRGL